MYCQKCHNKITGSSYVCDNCGNNNSPYLRQPNILFGTYRDTVPEYVSINNSGFQNVLKNLKNKFLNRVRQ